MWYETVAAVLTQCHIMLDASLVVFLIITLTFEPKF